MFRISGVNSSQSSKGLLCFCAAFFTVSPKNRMAKPSEPQASCTMPKVTLKYFSNVVHSAGYRRGGA
eukprot:6239973-Heterocapsa_arctica.AAC.1